MRSYLIALMASISGSGFDSYRVKELPSDAMRYALLIILVFLVFGCVKKDSIRYVSLPPKPVEQVQLLSGPPDKPFRVVGHVFVEGRRSHNWQSMAEGAREEAADMGADAVFMGPAEHYEAGTIVLPGGSTTTTTGTMIGSSSVRMNSFTSSGPTIAAPVMRKRLSGIAIQYQNP